MADQTKTKKSNIPGRILWPVVFLLSALVILTLSCVASYFLHYTKQHNYVISLIEGNITPKNQQTSDLLVANSQTDNLQTTGNGTLVEVKSDEDGQDKIWTTDTKVELFDSAYWNEKGELIAQSEDGAKIVAPGTGGSYTFSIENTGDINADYKVWLDANVNITSTGVPLQFRMSDESGWLTGEDGSWKTAEELNQITGKSRLDAGHSSEYTLYWRWPFERVDENGNDTSDGSGQASDAEDTTYGNKATEAGGATAGGELNVSQSISYTVTVHTQATEATDTETPVTEIPVTNPPVTELPVTSPPVTEVPTTRTPVTEAPDDSTRQPGNADSSDGNGAYEPDDSESERNPALEKENGSAVYAVKTGDFSNIELWILLAVIAGSVAVLESWYYLARRKERHKKQ